MAVDYAKRAHLLTTDICKRIKKLDFEVNSYTSEQCFLGNYEFDLPKELDDEYTDLLFTYGYDNIKEARRIIKSSDSRTYRLRKRIKQLLERGNCLFLTYTFTDDTLSSTNGQTRRKYIIRHLENNCPLGYVANIDYGGKNGREHYHALVCCDRVDNNTWQYGNIDFKRVRVGSTSIVKIPKYLNKLTQHAIKDTTKQCRIIYSKKPAVSI